MAYDSEGRTIHSYQGESDFDRTRRQRDHLGLQAATFLSLGRVRRCAASAVAAQVYRAIPPGTASRLRADVEFLPPAWLRSRRAIGIALLRVPAYRPAGMRQRDDNAYHSDLCQPKWPGGNS